MTEAMRGFVPEPNCGRGTISIFSSCLATVFLCTYTVMHLDIPRKGRKLHRILEKAVWVCIGILAPELIVFRAVTEWGVAYDIKFVLQRAGYEKASLVHGYFISMNGLYVRYSEGTMLVESREILDALLASQEEPKFAEKIPSEAEIMDRSKADFLGKAITCLQILWFLAQIVARHTEGMVISPLELSTVGYVLLAVVATCFWWKKPFNIMLPIQVTLSEPLPKTVGNIDWRWNYFVGPPATRAAHLIIWAAFTACFAGIHSAAWNYNFPRVEETLLWRTCSVLTFILPVIVGFSLILDVSWHMIPKWAFKYILQTTLPICYGLVRLFLITEAFLAFRYSPGSVYETVRWSSYWIHLGG